MYTPSREEFRRKAQQGNLVPVYREILADTETPVSAFLKIDRGDYAFLLESVEGGERVARYSFLGADPSWVFASKGNRVRLLDPQTARVQEWEATDPFAELERLMARYRPVSVVGLPPFHGGAVGYLAYDMVRFFEELPDTTEDDLGLPDSIFMLTRTILVFDRVAHKVKVVSNALVEDPSQADRAYDEAIGQIEALIGRLRQPQPWIGKPRGGAGTLPPPKSNMTREQFEASVRRIKEYIAAGDVIQTVFSQRFALPLTVEPFDFYRALRTVNPSPYMYFLRAGGSPHRRSLAGDAGSRRRETGPDCVRSPAASPRGATPEEEDLRLEQQLLADPKERAEHIMLVDLGRNDLGRVWRYGTVRVEDLMDHRAILSRDAHRLEPVVGELRPDKTAFDVIALRAPSLPGRLAARPKIRAMEIIDELEPTPSRAVRRRSRILLGFERQRRHSDHHPNAGDAREGGRYVQAGGGIVADSVPAKEFQESVRQSQGGPPRA
ncbi:MAG: anthranilate synthase component I [Candidatus Poribacteria bacterium]|nr:MAG: anthranilate synthase component I [Candidatus Poribacteria bacterium]